MRRSGLAAIPICGGGAVLLGIAYLLAAGAPLRLPLINLAALGIGLVLLVITRLVGGFGERARGPLGLAAALALLATALFGMEVESASRWVSLAGLAVQPSLLLVPPLLLAHAFRPASRISSLAVALAALASALQPDRSIATIIAAATLLLAWRTRSRLGALLASWCVGAAAVAWASPDQLPAVAFVDEILWTGFALHPLAGLALWTGSALLLLPALLLERRGERTAALVFVAVWGGAILAAALGNYPTPLVGYGASAILGYLLTALAVGRPQRHPARGDAFTAEHDTRQDGSSLRFA